jgi:hypothetical protein
VRSEEPALQIEIIDERTDRKQVFEFAGGIATYNSRARLANTRWPRTVAGNVTRLATSARGTTASAYAATQPRRTSHRRRAACTGRLGSTRRLGSAGAPGLLARAATPLADAGIATRSGTL